MTLSENHEAFRCLRPINRPSMNFVDNIRKKLEKNSKFQAAFDRPGRAKSQGALRFRRGFSYGNSDEKRATYDMVKKGNNYDTSFKLFLS